MTCSAGDYGLANSLMGKGLFITFEGIDGSGKSTQSRLLADHLRELSHDVISTREPGGSAGAEDIRKLLVEGDPDRWSAETEILLFTAARRDHIEKTIQPALSKGQIVISDRFVDSTRVYQGLVRADLVETVNKLHDDMIEREADITFIVDMDPEAALKRGLERNSGEDRFEEFGLDFQKSLRDGFAQIAKSNPKRCKLIDGQRSIEDIAEEIAKITLDHLS